MSEDRPSMYDWIVVAVLIGGSVAALFGNMAAVVWCLGLLALQQWGEKT